MRNRHPIRVNLLFFLVITLLSGCKTALEGEPSYALAQGCYALKATASQQFLVATSRQKYGFANVADWQAERFFLKPTGLGTFLLYDHEGGYLGTELITVERQWEANQKAEWRIKQLNIFEGKKQIDQTYTLVSTVDNLRLLVGKSGPIIQANPTPIAVKSASFELVPLQQESCKEFPEAALDAEISSEFYTPKDPNQPVTGYADLHSHIAFPKALGALAMAGNVFSPWGIEKALPNCAALHGKNGGMDLLENQTGGGSGHDTEGYPTFNYWPNRATNTHVQAYYRWIQRAYLSGLRVLVTDVTGNPSFCQLLSLLHIGKLEGDCKSDSDLEMQTRYMFDLQDYIDAQEGGPGKGWLRVVTSPAQAREAISENKLAVVLGTEYGTLFDCTESNQGCTADYIETKLTQLHDMGIRSVFPIHRFDNAFGGTQPAGGTSGAWMHLTGMMSTSNITHITDLVRPDKLLFKPVTGHFWELETCPEGVDGAGNIRSMRAFLNEDFGFVKNALLEIPTYGTYAAKVLDYAFFNKLEPIPEYIEFNEGGNACNVRPLQDVGRYLINRIVDKGMILEIDHMSYNTRMETLDVLENRQYSGIVSSHGWIENMPSMRERIFRLGGIMAPFNGTPSGIAATLKRYAGEMEPHPYLAAVGFGSDVQGVTSQPTGDGGFKIKYPFKSVDGLVTFTQPKTGDRTFDFNKEGIAHYGLYAEWIENLRQVDERDSEDLMNIFMNSAEAYLQMWERAEAQAIEPNE